MIENHKVLTQMIHKFSEKHGHPPVRIVVAPVALVALGLKKSVAPLWDGIPVECRHFGEEEVVSRSHSPDLSLGIFVRENRGRMQLVACDLKPLNKAMAAVAGA